MISMRFDMRVPGLSAQQIAARYDAAIEMVRWADDKAKVTIGLSEHHAAEDGYTSTPLIMAAAMAVVTRNADILIGCALLPMYEPVRLAEEMINLDYLSRGRVKFVFGIGYRPDEYELFGLDFSARGKIADSKIEQLLALIANSETCETMPRVTPAPFTPGGPTIFWGGASKAAARRAGRLGLGFLGQTYDPKLFEHYREACAEAGRQPGFFVMPPDEKPNIVFVHPNLDQAWDELGEYLLADATVYAQWNANVAHNTTSLSTAQTVDGLRDEQAAHQILTPEQAVQHIQQWGSLALHPLCGGCPPDLAWQYLKNVEDLVLPALTKP